jgi:pimeloyl-ACP methyl ester carboxylesterase
VLLDEQVDARLDNVREMIIEPVQVRMKGLHLSGLLALPGSPLQQEPLNNLSRGLIVALHGGGYSAGYWNCPVDGASLLELAAALGFHVLALDRPGYGLSQEFEPSRLGLAHQVELLFDAIETWEAANRFVGPKFIVGHSIGGILALLMAAHPRGRCLTGIDVLGVPIRFANTESGNAVQSWSTDESHLPVLSEALRKSMLFGSPGTYSSDADAHDRSLVRPMPVAEYLDAIAMPGEWERVLPTIRTPVQFTVAELDAMQVHDWKILEDVFSLLSGSRHRLTHSQVSSGHNASVHRIARAYHLRAVAFFEECLVLPALPARSAT